MDNYGKIKRALMLIYRDIRFKLQFNGIKIANGEDGNKIISDWLKSKCPGMVGRLGAVESRFIFSRMKNRQPNSKNLHNLNVCAGVFPLDEDILSDFYSEYISAINNTDIFVAWSVKGGGYIYRNCCPQATCVDFYSLEPFFYKNPWTSALRNRKVLIIHPFGESIKQQYANRDKIFLNKDILPEFKSFHVIKAVQSSAENCVQYKNWIEALNFMKNQILQTDFEVAIIGAGAYGLPLAAYVKSLGKQAIHMAGVTQLLFGIRGKRWDNDPLYQEFFNEYWIHPTNEERPIGSLKVEGGSYW